MQHKYFLHKLAVTLHKVYITYTCNIWKCCQVQDLLRCSFYVGVHFRSYHGNDTDFCLSNQPPNDKYFQISNHLTHSWVLGQTHHACTVKCTLTQAIKTQTSVDLIISYLTDGHHLGTHRNIHFRSSQHMAHFSPPPPQSRFLVYSHMNIPLVYFQYNVLSQTDHMFTDCGEPVKDFPLYLLLGKTTSATWYSCRVSCNVETDGEIKRERDAVCKIGKVCSSRG